MSDKVEKSFELKGKHVLSMWLGMFATIISVNVFMAWNALDSFPGMIVKNSYVASQNFNERMSQQLDLGWNPELNYKNGRLELALVGDDGKNHLASNIDVLIGRNTNTKDDVRPEFLADGDKYVSDVSLKSGYWFVEIKAKSLDGVVFNQRLDIYVD